MPRKGNLAVTRCISSIAAADYLQMSNTDRYIKDVETCFHRYPCDSRKTLLPHHLQLMHRHSFLFQKKAKGISAFAAKAAVRPFMTSHLFESPGKLDKNIRTEWTETASHFMGLMDNDTTYVANVMVEVRQTLRTAKRQDNVQLSSAVSFEYRGFPETQYARFDLVRY